MIQSLIDKQDSFELVRDQIAAILALEIANQQSLATAASKDPELWRLNIYSERANAWEQFLSPDVSMDTAPIVNVWYSSGTFNRGKGDLTKEQEHQGTVNIDCYGYGVPTGIQGGGHTLGDEKASLECERAIRLVRNILMSSEYKYLGLRGLVAERWLSNITKYQPESLGDQIQNVWGGRMRFDVDFIETSPQYEPVDLDYLSVNVLRAEDGQIIIEADYDYTI